MLFVQIRPPPPSAPPFVKGSRAAASPGRDCTRFCHDVALDTDTVANTMHYQVTTGIPRRYLDRLTSC
jgi:hypothetical protein